MISHTAFVSTAILSQKRTPSPTPVRGRNKWERMILRRKKWLWKGRRWGCLQLDASGVERVRGRGFSRQYLANRFKKFLVSICSCMHTLEKREISPLYYCNLPTLPLRASGRFFLFSDPHMLPTFEYRRKLKIFQSTELESARSFLVRLVRTAQRVPPLSSPLSISSFPFRRFLFCV